MTKKPPLRFALIGCAANIAPQHIAAIARLPKARIIGMADVNVEKGSARAKEVDAPFFSDHEALLSDLQPDVAVVCTPHPFHASIAIDCFAAGAHVLVEKPIAPQVSEADRMVAAARQADRLLAVSFQHRFSPATQKVRRLIDEGVTGPLIRVLCIEPWFRTAAYYRAATWRATWKGEGGGVLLNQAPHTLDLLCDLAGMPAKIWGWTRTLHHQIECEDTAQAMLEYPNGAPGYFTASTVEAGTQRRLEIVGEHGALELVGQTLKVSRFTPSLRTHMTTSSAFFQPPEVDVLMVAEMEEGSGHFAVYHDLYTAITEGRPLCVDGVEATKSLELANAITLSSHTVEPVALPLDRDAYASLFAKLQAGVKV